MTITTTYGMGEIVYVRFDIPAIKSSGRVRCQVVRIDTQTYIRKHSRTPGDTWPGTPCKPHVHTGVRYECEPTNSTTRKRYADYNKLVEEDVMFDQP
jgi:hypothetical protein